MPFYRETVIYIPVIPNHWGHFLLDCLCRFWFINDDKYKDYRIAFCGYNWSNNQVEGNYLELLHLMGIDDSRLIYIKDPCSFACVLIPEPTLGYTIANSHYRNIIDTIIANVYKSEAIKKLQPYEKIYFSRAHFWRSSMKKIEKFLREQKPELLHHQKFLENGTAERAKESGTEQNYNMIDGCVNNNPKKPRIIGNRISVLDRLHIKLEERKQKSQPQQQQQQERSRKS